MERSLNWVPFCYKARVWSVLFPERLSNTFPETGRAAGVASASVHRNFEDMFQAGKLRPAGTAAVSPRAQDFISHQHPPMHERNGNTYNSEPFKQAMPAQQIIPSASPNLLTPGFIYSLAPPENRSLQLQEVIAHHTWLPGAGGNLPWCQKDALQVPDKVETAPWRNVGRSGLLQLQAFLSRDLFYRERIKLRSRPKSWSHIVNPPREHMSAMKGQNAKWKILVFFTFNPLQLFPANTKFQPLPLKKW